VCHFVTHPRRHTRSARPCGSHSHRGNRYLALTTVTSRAMDGDPLPKQPLASSENAARSCRGAAAIRHQRAGIEGFNRLSGPPACPASAGEARRLWSRMPQGLLRPSNGGLAAFRRLSQCHCLTAKFAPFATFVHLWQCCLDRPRLSSFFAAPEC
jgi:hypothetical protein